jgi:4-hydroxybenzoyl-CoA reductase subunit beta
VQLAGPRGSREARLEDFYRNDGMARMNKAPDEIVVAVRVPASSAGWRGTYKKLRIRQSIDYPLAGVAVVMRKDAGGVCLEARVALTGVNPAPRVVKAAEQLAGKIYSEELVEQVGQEAIRTAKPLRTSASTPEYRRQMVRVFVRRALRELWLDGRSHPAAS